MPDPGVRAQGLGEQSAGTVRLAASTRRAGRVARSTETIGVGGEHGEFVVWQRRMPQPREHLVSCCRRCDEETVKRRDSNAHFWTHPLRSPPVALEPAIPVDVAYGLHTRHNVRVRGLVQAYLLQWQIGISSAFRADRPRPETPRRIPARLTEAVGSGVPTPRHPHLSSSPHRRIQHLAPAARIRAPGPEASPEPGLAPWWAARGVRESSGPRRDR
jgi:hypothetical protein